MSAGEWVITELVLEATTRAGLRIGGPSGHEHTDMPVFRNPGGRPVIPGSSLKGVLRSTAERLLRANGLPVCDPFDTPCGGRLGDQPTVGTVADIERCWCCRVFGSPHAIGRLRVGDLTPTHPVDTVVRDGVGIDRAELKAADGIKFDYEVVPPGVTFTGTLRLEDREEGDLGFLLGLLELFDLGVIGLGGGFTRGLGTVEMRCTTVQEVRASGWRPGDGFVPLDPEVLDQERVTAGRILDAGEVTR